jgi:diacylglycerol kinase (ATP)
VEVVEATGDSAAATAARAEQAMAEGVDAVVVCGGDGTVNLGVQLVADTDTPLGIIPVGTGDDNARTLGIPLKDVQQAVEVIAAGHVRTVDLGHVTAADGTGRWFLGVMSSGFDSLVNERANRMSWPKGKARYLVAVVAELSVFKALPYEVQVDGVNHDGTAMLVAVGNGVSYGGGMQVCPAAVPDDGLLSVTFLGEVSKPTFLKVFPRVFNGSHVTHPAVSEISGRHIRIDAPGQVAYADGERVGLLPVQVEVRPGTLHAYVPSGR